MIANRGATNLMPAGCDLSLCSRDERLIALAMHKALPAFIPIRATDNACMRPLSQLHWNLSGMADRSNPTQGIISGLLSGWIVGPFYGANIVMAVIVVQRLWSHRMHKISSLMLITCLIVAACTAHAFIYLDDLIVGFTSADEVNTAQEISNYFLTFRFNVLACYFLRVCNGFCNKLFVTWRVYVIWGHNKPLAALLTVPHLAELALNVASGYYVSRTHTSDVELTGSLLLSAWVLSTSMQVTALLLIAWRTVGTPKIVDARMQRDNLLPAIFYAFVDSSCLTLITDVLTVAFARHDQSISLIFLAALGQVSGLSSLAIILREIFKAEQDVSRGVLPTPQKRTRALLMP
ncbi:hypothetical protein PENSPDRAFT_506614 [Peniophora sp. CONT]|nr:hypothetical protein PENSPDRAFT_506614 [Peniophora sp. CONT]